MFSWTIVTISFSFFFSFSFRTVEIQLFPVNVCISVSDIFLSIVAFF